MKLGLLTAAFGDLSLEQVADWAAANGYEALEVACWPSGEGASRRYAGVSHIDVDRLDAGAVHALLDARGLELSALAYYPNALDPDDDARAPAHAHLRKVIVAAEALGVEVVGTFAGRDKARGLKQNLARFAELWPPLVDFAGEHDVKLAIENCPMIFSDDEWPGGTNLAYCPAAWREMFALVDRDNFGLNFDPSHLVWQFIDYERAVYEFGDRIFHVHGVENLHRVPEGLSDCAATLAEPLACVCHCLLEPPVVAPADRVLVIGPGAIGLLHDGRVELEPLVTELVPLAEWERAFDASRAGAGVKYVLDPGA